MRDRSSEEPVRRAIELTRTQTAAPRTSRLSQRRLQDRIKKTKTCDPPGAKKSSLGNHPKNDDETADVRKQEGGRPARKQVVEQSSGTGRV